MKFPVIISLLACLAGPVAKADVTSAGADGYLSRGILMLEDKNYSGCVDQLARISSLASTPAQREEAHYYMGLATLALGDDEALAVLRSFLESYPASLRRADVMMSIGDYRYFRGDWPEALAEYSRVDPMALTAGRQDELSFRTSYCYLMLGEPEMARSGFASLQGKPEWRSAACFYLGYIAYTDKDYNTALSYFNSTDRSTAPGDAAPYYEAQIQFAQGNYDRALTLVKGLLASSAYPEFVPECNRIAGESLYNLGRRSEAVPYLWKYCAESKEPLPSAFYILGTDEYDKGDTEAAIKLLQQAIGSHSAMEQSAWLFLGQAYRQRGDNSSALMAFENAYKVNYDREVREIAFYNYAVARMDGGRVPFGNSVSLLENFLEEYPNSRYADDVQKYIITGYMSENDYTAALAAINRVKNPSKSMLAAKQRVLFMMGTREYTAGRTADAITHLNEAIALASKGGTSDVANQATLWLGDCYFTHGNYDEAATCYKEYIRKGKDASNVALARYDLGYSRFVAEDYRQALAEFAQAAGAMEQPGVTLPASVRADAITRGADCLYYLEDFAKAETEYRKAYDLDPAAADYPLFQMALMQGLQKDHASKIANIDRLISQFPSSGLIPSAMLEKAESQAAMGKTDEAVKTYNRLVALYPGTAPGRNGYLQLAITYINRGETAKGIDTYKKVITTFPTSEEARIAADDLKQIYAEQGRLREFVAFIESVPNAPKYEVSDLEKAAFEAAENAYVSKGSVTALKAYLTDYPDGPSAARATYYLAESAWNAGNASEAQGYAAKVLLKHPDSDVAEDAMLIKGNAEAALGKTEIAYGTFSELEGRASGANMLRDARMGMLRTASDLGKYAEVVATADKLLSTTASTTPADLQEVKFMRAVANDRLGNHEKAYADWEELAASPAELTGAKSAYYMGQSLLDTGKTDRALKVADKLISSDTPHRYWLARGFILYSDILRKQGKKFEADEYLKSLRSNYPGTEADIFQMIDSRLK